MHASRSSRSFAACLNYPPGYLAAATAQQTELSPNLRETEEDLVVRSYDVACFSRLSWLIFAATAIASRVSRGRSKYDRPSTTGNSRQFSVMQSAEFLEFAEAERLLRWRCSHLGRVPAEACMESWG